MQRRREDIIIDMKKQQASLLSFFGNKGKKKRKAESTSSNDNLSSVVQSPVRKQIKKSSCIDEGSCNDDDVPSLKPNSPDVVECCDAATYTYTQKDDTLCEQTSTTSSEYNKQEVVAANKASLPNPEAASDTPTTDDTAESSSDGSESEEEKDDDNSSTTSNNSIRVGASSNNSSAPSSNNSTSNTKYKGKSAYEILREKNIERNNERLRSLGLLVGINVQQQNNHNSNSSGKKKRKKVAKNSSSSAAKNAVATLPTRRSSRLKQPVVTEKGSLLEEVCHDGNEKGAAAPSNGGQVNIMEVQEEEFTVSPLFEYQMMSTNNNASTNTITNEDNGKRDEDGKNGQVITTLVPNGPRLNPPSGLNAIYSLQFHPHFLRGSEENHWLVGAGKAGLIALWDCSKRNHHHSLEEKEEEEEEDKYIDPVISWKGHGGRWIADARFIPPPPSSTSSSNNSSNNNVPSRY